MSTLVRDKHSDSRLYLNKLGQYRSTESKPMMLKEIDRINRSKLTAHGNREQIKNKDGRVSSISFSHRAVSLAALKAKNDLQKVNENQSEINRLTNYVRPQVHKLNPSQISENIKMRYKLEKLMPKKDLQPKLYSRSSLYMQNQLRMVDPCNNYKSKRWQARAENGQMDRPSVRLALEEKKQREMDASRFSKMRSLEHNPDTVKRIMAYASRCYNNQVKKQAKASNQLSPLNYLLKYAKSLTKVMKSDDERCKW